MVFPALHSFSFSDSFLFKKQTAYNMFLKKVFIKIKTFLGGHRTCRILVPCSGIKPAPHALEMRCLNHWTTREILNSFESTSILTLSPFLLGDFCFLNWILTDKSLVENHSFIFYILNFLLEYNGFTPLCQFLLHNKVNQLNCMCVYIYIPFPLEPLSHSPGTHPCSLGHHRAPSWVPCAIQQVYKDI